jgi:hypothetical protein
MIRFHLAFLFLIALSRFPMRKLSCVERFHSPGYNYDKPGMNTFALSVLGADGQPGPVLVYTQVMQWNVPCGGHPIGTEGRQILLTLQ